MNNPKTTKFSNRRMLPLLVAMVALSQMAFNIYLPSLPKVGEAFSATSAQVQYTVTLYMLALASGQLFIGVLSDRFGRKPIVIAGLALYLIASLVCAFADTLFVLILGRIAQAIGAGSGIVLTRTIISDMNDKNASASMLGYVTMAMMVVPAVTAFIGGSVQDAYGWRSNFLIIATLCAGVLVATSIKLPETNLAPTSRINFKSLLGSYSWLLRSAAFCGYTLTATFSSAMFWVFAAASSHIIIEQMGRSATEYGAYFTLGPAGFIVGNFISGKLSIKHGADKMLHVGNIIGLVGGGIMMGFALMGVFTPLAICGPYFVIAFSNGLTVTNGIAGAISVNPKLAGTAAGFAGFLQISLAAIAVWLTGLLENGTQFPMIWTILGCGALALTASATTKTARESSHQNLHKPSR